MARKGKSVQVVHADEDSIVLITAQGDSGGVHILGFESEHGPWESDDAMDAALRTFLETHAAPGAPLYTILPRHEIKARIVDLPSQDREEIKNMLRLSIDEYVPYPEEELVIDIDVLDTLPTGDARVLATFAQKEVVGKYLDRFRAAYGDPDDLLLSTACLASVAPRLPKTETPSALVHANAGGIEVLVSRDGAIRYARGVVHSQALPSDEEATAAFVRELMLEIQGSLAAYRRESDDGVPVDRVFFSANWRQADDIARRLAEELSIPCETVDFSSIEGLSNTDALAGAPGVVVGGALSVLAAESHISLLPASAIAEREQSARRALFTRAAGLAAVVVIGLLAVFGVRTYQYGAYIDDLEAQIAEIEPNVRGVVEKQKQLSTLKRQVERSGTALQLLARLAELTPEDGVNITRFLFKDEEGIVIEGRAKQLYAIDRLTEDMRDLGRSGVEQFANAQQMYTQNQEERGARVIDFSISAVIDKNEGEDLSL